MSRRADVVRVSSRGQIVIPAPLRRRMGIKTGERLSIRPVNGDALILRPSARDAGDLDGMLRRLRRASAEMGRDLLAELHERRARERDREARERGRRSH